jgi:Sec-independent protein translocase protein TatA
VFDLSPEKILFLGVIAVMVLGPDRLPQAARTLARVLHQLRTLSGSVQDEMRDALAEPRKALNDAVGDLGLPTDLGIPRMPTARGLVAQALNPPAIAADSRAAERHGVEASADDVAAVDISSPGLAPDDPSLN